MMTFALKKQGYTHKLFKMLLSKGVYPYEYLVTQHVLQETSLPSKDKFYSTLTSSHIIDENYKYTQAVFREGNVKKLRNV